MQIKKVLTVTGLALMILLQTGCGTLLHPERSGRTGGRIDPAIALLDGIGVLFYVIPGLVAFAVDFNNGTIYLPHGNSATNDQTEPSIGHRTVAMDKPVDAESLEQLIEHEYSISDVLHNESLEVYPTL